MASEQRRGQSRRPGRHQAPGQSQPAGQRRPPGQPRPPAPAGDAEPSGQSGQSGQSGVTPFGGTPSGPQEPVTGEVGQEQQDQGALASRRRMLTWISLGLSGLAGAVVSIPILSYLLSPLIRPSPREWIDVGPMGSFDVGTTVLRAIKEFSPLAWAGQTAETAVWVRRATADDFTVFSVNCTHLGCPVNWQDKARIFLCPCHGGVYYADGTVAGGPPPRPLFRYETRLQSGTLQVRSLGLQVAE